MAAQVAFTIEGWSVIMKMPLPDEHDQVLRGRWRGLLLAIKAKLLSVETGVETFEEAFMAHLVVDSSGRTIGQTSLEPLRTAHAAGAPRLLGAGNP